MLEKGMQGSEATLGILAKAIETEDRLALVSFSAFKGRDCPYRPL